MNAISQFHFLRPGWLLLLPAVMLAWYWIRRSNDPLRGWREVIQPDLLRALVFNDQPGKKFRLGGLLAFWSLASIAIAGPTWRPQPSPFADDPYPVVVVLKADESMNLSDIAPSRMERATLKVADLANARKGLPTGLVAYAGTAHLVLPPTRDTAVVATMGTEISPEIMPRPGDELSEALNRAEQSLEDGRGSIVVVTDKVSMPNDNRIEEFAENSSASIILLAVASEDSPELDSIRTASNELGGYVTVMSADDSDISEIVRRTTKASQSVSADDATVRWAEAGWWLTPVIAVLVLIGYRKSEATVSEVVE